MTGRSAWTAPLIVGLAATVGVALFVPFSADTGTGQRWFFSALIGGFAGYGAWSLAGVVPLVRDLAGWMRGRRTAPGEAAIQHKGPLPVLSPSRQAVVRRMVGAMADHGLFAPDRPDPQLFYAGTAERDEPVTPEVILSALGELDYYHPGTDPRRFSANLLFLDFKTEQDPAYLADLVDALARLGGDGWAVTDVRVDAPWPSQGRTVPVRVDMAVNGAPLGIAYSGDIKYHSTYIPHALAHALDAAATGRRLAWMAAPDQGYWIAGLADGGVDTLNAALKLSARSDYRWSWVADAPPYAAGEQGLGE